MTNLPDNFTKLTQRINEAVRNSTVSAKSVQLLAVSKRHSADAIRTLFELGQRDFGENYLQEAIDKQEALADLDISWHFIGRVQRNKTRIIAERFDWLHSLDRLSVAERLGAQRPSTLAPLNVCIQINIDDEDSKGGLRPELAAEFATTIETLPGLRLRGLMAIPQAGASEHDRLRSMEKMNALYQTLQSNGHALDTLSMGMSADLENAVATGATMLRIGEALFGPRSN